MQTITDEYRGLNQALHQTNSDYGVSGKKHAADIIRLAMSLETQDVLDYGCGKGTLAEQMPFKIKQYDPAIDKHSHLPEAADIVVCTDVLEHIEPKLIDKVFAHLQSLVKKVGYFTIATRPARKTLADGRNAHLIVEPANWWLCELSEHFDILRFQKSEGECLVIVEPKKRGY